MSDFDARLRLLWREFQASMGLTVAPSVQDAINRRVFMGEEESANGDPELADSLICSLRERLEEYCLVLSSKGRGTECGGEAPQGMTKRVKMKSLERRLHMYFYVSAHLESPGKRVKRGHWSRVTDEWNRDHPHDSMTPATLAREWHYNRVDSVLLENVQLVELAFVDAFTNWVNAAPPYDMTVASDPLNPVYWILRGLKKLVTSADKN